MRNLLILLGISACLLSMGCSANDKNDESLYLTPVIETNDEKSNEFAYLTPVTAATISAYGTVGAPIKGKLDAVIVARRWMWGSRIVNVGDPQVVYAEQLNLAEASQKLGIIPQPLIPTT